MVVHPVAVVLVKELFVFRCPHVISLGVAPAPKQLTWCEIVVIDDPKLIEGGHAQHEMLEIRVVVDGIDVKPIARLTAWGAVVQIDLLNRLADHPEIGLGLVKILHEVVPGMPFPHNFGTTVVVGGQFQDHFRPQPVFWNQTRVSPRLQRFVCGEVLPGDGKHVAIWFHFDVVVQTRCAVVQRE